MARVKLGPYTQRRGILNISSDTFNGIEEYIRWAEEAGNPYLHQKWMDYLVRFMAYVNQGIAQRMSAGPYDPSQRRPHLAWRTPAQGIRRISERYYIGWKVRRLNRGTWQLYNDSREAYFIEFGISEVGWGAGRHVPEKRIRRPVRKLSLRRTLDGMMRTQAYHRVWCEIYANPRKGKPKSRGFTQIVQSPGKNGFTGLSIQHGLQPISKVG